MSQRPFDDRKLETPNQQFVREVVKALPEEPLSLTWRSSLNESVLAQAAKSRRRKWMSWIVTPTVGLGFAGVLAVLVVFNLASPKPQAQTAPTQPVVAARESAPVEAALVQDYRKMSDASDVAGAGLNPLESAPSSRNQDTGWSESDIDSL